MFRQEALGQLADHEPALHAEQERADGAEHAGHAGQRVGARPAGGAGLARAGAEQACKGVATGRVATERVASKRVVRPAGFGGEVGKIALEAHGQPLEDGPQGRERLVGPLGAAEEADRRAGRGFSRLGQDPLLGGRGDLGEALTIGGGDGRLLLALEGHPVRHLAGDLPVDGPVGLEEAQHLTEIEPPEGTQRLRGIAHAASLWA